MDMDWSKLKQFLIIKKNKGDVTVLHIMNKGTLNINSECSIGKGT